MKGEDKNNEKRTEGKRERGNNMTKNPMINNYWAARVLIRSLDQNIGGLEKEEIHDRLNLLNLLMKELYPVIHSKNSGHNSRPSLSRSYMNKRLREKHRKRKIYRQRTTYELGRESNLKDRGKLENRVNKRDYKHMTFSSDKGMEHIEKMFKYFRVRLKILESLEPSFLEKAVDHELDKGKIASLEFIRGGKLKIVKKEGNGQNNLVEDKLNTFNEPDLAEILVFLKRKMYEINLNDYRSNLLSKIYLGGGEGRNEGG